VHITCNSQSTFVNS